MPKINPALALLIECRDELRRAAKDVSETTEQMAQIASVHPMTLTPRAMLALADKVDRFLISGFTKK